MSQLVNMKRTRPQQQSGIALPIVLIFLVVMLLLGVTAIRNVTLGEKMAGNLRNQQLAFQAAEKALRYCENAVQTHPLTLPTGLALQAPAAAPANLWDITSTTNNWKSDSTVSVVVDQVAGDGTSTPSRCMVEDVSGDLRLRSTETESTRKAYRITARGIGGTDNAVVLLQSYLTFN